jgi:hypothetical protein
MADRDADQQIFYTHPQAGFDASGRPKFDHSASVRSKFLVLNGKYVVDPNIGPKGPGSDQNTLYSRLDSKGQVDPKSIIGNPHNYFIVPAKFEISDAVAFAVKVNAAIAAGSKVPPSAGRIAGDALMVEGFQPTGSMDIQRGRAGGVPADEVNPAFKDSASWLFGFVTEQVAIPNTTAEAGAGDLNKLEYHGDEIISSLKNLSDMSWLLPTEKYFPAHKRPDGPLGMDKGDAIDFEAGIKSAEMAGFHKAVIENAAPEIGPLAPFHAPPANVRPKQGQTQHTAAECLHRAIMDAAASTPMDVAMRHNQAAEFGGSALGASGSTSFLASMAMSRSGGSDQPFAAMRGDRELREAGRDAGAGGLSAVTSGNAAYLPLHESLSMPGAASVHGTILAERGDRAPLPSLAPMSLLARNVAMPTSEERHHSLRDPQVAVRHKAPDADHGIAPGRSVYHSAGQVRRKGDETLAANGLSEKLMFKRYLAELLDEEARRPPSGATGFDPRLSPAWAGLKLSV